MGSYGVIKEALLVKKNESSNEYSIVQKLVPATVNGMVDISQDGGFELHGSKVSYYSVYRGGAFGFSEWSESGAVFITVNIPGYGVKSFRGKSNIQNVNGVGQGVLCTPIDSDPTATYTHLCLVVESPGMVFDKSLG